MSFEPRMSAPLTEKKPLLSTAGRNRCRSIPAPFFGSTRFGDWAAAGAAPRASADAAAAAATAHRKRPRAKGTDLLDGVIGLLAFWLIGAAYRTAGSGGIPEMRSPVAIPCGLQEGAA